MFADYTTYELLKLILTFVVIAILFALPILVYCGQFIFNINEDDDSHLRKDNLRYRYWKMIHKTLK